MPTRRLLLLSVVLLLLVYNWWHFNHRRPGPHPMPAEAIADSTDIWTAYDNAVNLRDAPETQYGTAVDRINSAKTALPNPNLKVNADALADLRGCMLWLQFYRQTVNKPNPDPAWRERSLQHIQSCSKNHADIAH